MTGTNSLTAVFKPLQWQLPAWRDKSPVVLLSGSAGGGKSRLAAEKVHAFAYKYPGATCLMVRKTRESMVNSTVLFFKHRIIGEDRRVVHVESKNRFEYPNGSVVAYGGMKDDEQREAIRGIGQDGGLDFTWIEEATRLTEADYNELLARKRGKAAGWRQIILTTNPDAPTHWINRRLIVDGEASVYYSGALDNPHNPPDYIASLNTLTGILRARLVEGKWVQAEGVVYDNFSPEENISEDADYHPSWPVVWGCDDGYAYGQGVGHESYHPRVILVCQHTPIGGLNVIAEYVATGVADYNDSIRAVLELEINGQRVNLPELCYVDSSAAMFKGAIQHHGLMTLGATHPVSEGIRNVRRMICDGNGVRLLRIHPRCTHTIREFQLYRYAEGGVSGGERKPLKLDDHSMDSLRYAAWSLRSG